MTFGRLWGKQCGRCFEGGRFAIRCRPVTVRLRPILAFSGQIEKSCCAKRRTCCGELRYHLVQNDGAVVHRNMRMSNSNGMGLRNMIME
jgi:hypothetical protein